MTLHLASPSVEYSPSNYKGLYCLFHIWLSGLRDVGGQFDAEADLRLHLARQTPRYIIKLTHYLRDSRDFTFVGGVILLRRKTSP